ncbi:MAG TPA: hypothetical protein PK728_09190 [Bacillota bacterium]|nr:hypothetical protein [Bacillota bacterium]
MMDQDDFEEINRLLEKCCDGCLLTRYHCTTCRIEKLRGIIGQISESGEYELISTEELKIFLKLAGRAGPANQNELKTVEKWRHVLGKAGD